MAGTAVKQQSPVPLRGANQIQATGDEDAANEVVLEEAVTNNVVDNADASTDPHKHYQTVTSREK